jgi:hypothetical protein
MVDITRPMILRIGTSHPEKDWDKIKKLLISAGYQTTDEQGQFIHNTVSTLSAEMRLDETRDLKGNPLQTVIEVILSDADNYVNQTIYNALATVFPLKLTK